MEEKDISVIILYPERWENEDVHDMREGPIPEGY